MILEQELKTQHSNDLSSLESSHRREKVEWEERQIEELQAARTQPLIAHSMEEEYSRLSDERETLREELEESSALIRSLKEERDALVKQSKSKAHYL